MHGCKTNVILHRFVGKMQKKATEEIIFVTLFCENRFFLLGFRCQYHEVLMFWNWKIKNKISLSSIHIIQKQNCNLIIISHSVKIKWNGNILNWNCLYYVLMFKIRDSFLCRSICLFINLWWNHSSWREV